MCHSFLALDWLRGFPLTSHRMKIMDDALAQKDKLLGWMCYRLDRLPQGLLLVPLRGEDCKLTGGKLLLEVHTKIIDTAQTT